MTDNGTAAGHRAGMRGGKGSEYDGGHRVPFFIRWPGKMRANCDIAPITAHIDILPTLIDLCALSKPGNLTFDGVSLVPLLTGRADWPERTLFVHSQRIDHPRKWRKCAVMTNRWRLINGKELYDMLADPGQEKNVAATNPETCQMLREAYERWWADLSGRFDDYCEIVVGSKKGPPSRLTAHDWHGESVPWDQSHIRRGLQANGFWAIEVAHPGKYEFELRRWPVEVDQPITSAIPGGKAIQATKARLKIADVDVTQPIPKGASAVTFRVGLEPGKTRLQTWFIDDDGASRGAYYVYAKRL
jgi:hypothetical protein